MRRQLTNLYLTIGLFLVSCNPNSEFSGENVVFNQYSVYYSSSGMGYNLQIINNNEEPVSYLEIRVYCPEFDFVYVIEENIKAGGTYEDSFYHSSYQGVVNFEVLAIE